MMGVEGWETRVEAEQMEGGDEGEDGYEAVETETS